MVIGVTNGYFSHQLFTSTGNDFAPFNTLTGNSLQFVQNQTPNMVNVAAIQLHTITMTVSFTDNSLTEKGSLIYGLVNEVLGDMAEYSGDSATAYTELSARAYNLDKLLLMPTTRRVPISTLIGNPITIVGHAFSPASESFADPNMQTLTLTDDMLELVNASPPNNIEPNVLRAAQVANGKIKSGQKTGKTITNKLPGVSPSDVGFNVVKDMMVPFCIYIPQEGSGASGQPLQMPPRIEVCRTWIATRHYRDVPSTAAAPGVPTITSMVQEVTDRIPKSARNVANKLMHDLVVLPAMTGENSGEQLVSHLAKIAEKGVAWATSPEGQKVLGLGVKLLGTGLSAAVGVL